jgi:hypothetical protein
MIDTPVHQAAPESERAMTAPDAEPNVASGVDAVAVPRQNSIRTIQSH